MKPLPKRKMIKHNFTYKGKSYSLSRNQLRTALQLAQIVNIDSTDPFTFDLKY